MSIPSDHTIYCAGPMFSPGDKWEMRRIAKHLEEHGYKTYLPQRDGMEMGSIMKLGGDSGNSPIPPDQVKAVGMALMRAIFSLDIYQLLGRCRAVVFNMNGRVPDGGSVAEASAAFTANKPVLIYKNDPITLMAGMDNPMIMGLSYTWQTTDSKRQIPQALERLINAYEKDFAPAPLNPSRHLQSVLDFGEAVSKLVTETGEVKTQAEAVKLITALMALAVQFPAWEGGQPASAGGA